VIEFLRPGSAGELADAFGEGLDSVVGQVAEYMATAPVVQASDVSAFRSDGRWIWTAAAVKAVRNGKVSVRLEFAEAVLAADGPPMSLSGEERSQAMEAIMNLGRSDERSS
jgi:hypothetical protein